MVINVLKQHELDVGLSLRIAGMEHSCTLLP